MRVEQLQEPGCRHKRAVCSPDDAENVSQSAPAVLRLSSRPVLARHAGVSLLPVAARSALAGRRNATPTGSSAMKS